MLLRVIVIVLLVLLILRALARVLLRGALRREESRRQEPSRPGPKERRQLTQCPACGAYFEAGRGLPQSAGDTTRVCSEACRDAVRSGSPPA